MAIIAKPIQQALVLLIAFGLIVEVYVALVMEDFVSFLSNTKDCFDPDVATDATRTAFCNQLLLNDDQTYQCTNIWNCLAWYCAMKGSSIAAFQTSNILYPSTFNFAMRAAFGFAATAVTVYIFFLVAYIIRWVFHCFFGFELKLVTNVMLVAFLINICTIAAYICMAINDGCDVTLTSSSTKIGTIALRLIIILALTAVTLADAVAFLSCSEEEEVEDDIEKEPLAK